MNETNLLNGLLEIIWNDVCDGDGRKYTKFLKSAGFSAREAYNDLNNNVGLSSREAFDEVKAVYEDVTKEKVTGIWEMN